MDVLALVLWLCAHAQSVATAEQHRSIRHGQFTSLPCSHPSVSSDVLEATSSYSPTTSSTLLACAVSCGKNVSCAHAVYQPANQTCYIIPTTQQDTSGDFSPGSSSRSRWQESSCIVLTRVQPDIPPPLWQTVSLDYNSLTLIQDLNIPMKVFDGASLIMPVSHISIDKKTNNNSSTPSIVLSMFRREFVLRSDSKTLIEPVRQPVSYLFLDAGTIYTLMFDNKGNLLSQDQSNNPASTILQKTITFFDGSPQHLVSMHGVSEVRAGMLKGYRPVRRHPTRCEMDQVSGDVQLSMTDTFMVSSQADVEGAQLYVTSIKESLKERRRYVYHHQINNGASLPREEENVGSGDGWMLDTSWSLVEPVDGSQTLVEALFLAVMEGREIRLVMGDTVATDVSIISLTPPHEAIACLERYLVPEGGVESQGVTQRVRLPIFGAGSKVLIECEKEFQGSVVYNIKKVTYPGVTSWFASNRNWTRVLSMNAGLNVVYGSHEELYNRAENGHNIRVCVRFGTLATMAMNCYGTSSVKLVDNVHIVVTGIPGLMYTEQSEDKTLKSLIGQCKIRVPVIGSAGWVKMLKYFEGMNDEVIHTITVQDMHWFVDSS